jgi:hypothetical protein
MNVQEKGCQEMKVSSPTLVFLVCVCYSVLVPADPQERHRYVLDKDNLKVKFGTH